MKFPLFVIAIFSALAVRGADPIQDIDYRDMVLSSVTEPTEFVFKSDEVYRSNHAYAACVYLKVASWTNNKAFAERALDLLDALVKSDKRSDDYNLVYPVLVAYRDLDVLGMLNSDFKKRFEEILPKVCVKRERGDHDRAALNAQGLALALKLFPNSPQAGVWRSYVAGVWHDWYRQLDTTENATQYNAAFLNAIVGIASITGRDIQLKRFQVQAMFQRYRDQITPGGFMPGYGESEPFARAGRWAQAFEQGAKIFQDPTLRWAAIRLAPLRRPSPRSLTQDGNFNGMVDVFSWCETADWKDSSLVPLAPDTSAALHQKRLTDNAQPLDDKLILAPNRNPGVPFILVDLLGGQAPRGQPQWGALDYLEWRGTPLLHGGGAANRAPEFHNLLLVRSAQDEFPIPTEPFKANTWKEAVLPARALLPLVNTDDHSQPFTLEQITLRVESKKWNMLTLEAPRLLSPDGERVMNGFTVPEVDEWKGATRNDVIGGHAKNTRALGFLCDPPPDATGRRIVTITRKINESFSPSESSEIRVWWKLADASQGWQRPLSLRLQGHDAVGHGVSAEWQVPFLQLLPLINAVRVDSRDGDSLGYMSFKDWFNQGTIWNRMILLTRDGIIFVRDELIPGANTSGLVAGPLWHLWSDLEKGDGWFDTAADSRLHLGKRRLLVSFPPALRDSLGVQTSTLWTDNQPNTVFARKMLEPGRLQVFSTILIPHEENETNRDIAAAIEWHEQPDSPTYADVTLRGRKTTLMVSPEGKWSVKRVNIPKPVPPVTAPSAVPAATPSAPVTVPPTSGGK